jgi:hypothetical protein
LFSPVEADDVGSLSERGAPAQGLVPKRLPECTARGRRVPPDRRGAVPLSLFITVIGTVTVMTYNIKGHAAFRSSRHMQSCFSSFYVLRSAFCVCCFPHRNETDVAPDLAAFRATPDNPRT